MASPIFKVAGVVVRGFGRGSKQLGIPTANLNEEAMELLEAGSHPLGVYCGWCQVNDGPVYNMVMSMGWNPYFKNIKKSLEVHILHNFPEDFYGSELKVMAVSYLRPEADFPSCDALIAAIQKDISDATDFLKKPECKLLARDPFFSNRSLL